MQHIPESKKTTAPLNQHQIEQALELTLKSGAQSIPQQIRYILAISQMMSARTSTQPYGTKPLTISQARVSMLVGLAASLNNEQIHDLAGEINAMDNPGVRLWLLARIGHRLPSSRQRTILQDFLTGQIEIKDPAMRAEALFHLAQFPLLKQPEGHTSATLPKILEVAMRISNTETRVRSLTALVEYAPPDAARYLVRHVLDDIATTQNEKLRSNTISALAEHIPAGAAKDLLDSIDMVRTPIERAQVLIALIPVLPNKADLSRQCLDFISAIPADEDRTEALIDFAPCMTHISDDPGYAEILKHALTIALSMSRRPLRARSLVALSPFLPNDLKGEALATVNSLANERERAQLLAKLAPLLPHDMVVASLAIAHTMREQDARVQALGVLAHYAPEYARSQTILDALAAASNLPNHYERVGALISLVDILPPQLQDQAFTNALETTRLIDNENARARALSLLGHYLPERLLGRALEAANDLNDSQQRLNTLTSLAPRLSAKQQQHALRTMLECARQMPFEFKRATALVSIAPHLTEALVPEALAIADSIHDPYDVTNAYIALAHKLPPKERSKRLSHARTLIKQIEDGYDHACALTAILPLLDEADHADLESEALAIVNMIEDDYDQASAIGLLAPIVAKTITIDEQTPLPESYALIEQGILIALDIPYQGIRVVTLQKAMHAWARLDKMQRYALWIVVARRLKTLPLADVLLCLDVMVTVIEAMAGDTFSQELIRILSTGRNSSTE